VCFRQEQEDSKIKLSAWLINGEQESFSIATEPSIKQRRDPTILPSFLIGLLIHCNFLYNQAKNLHAFNFFKETKNGDSTGESFLYQLEGRNISGPQLLGSTVESLVVEFDKEKFEQLLSSGSISPKVSSKTRFQVSSEISHREAHKLFDKENGSTSLEGLTTSRGANKACDNVSQVTRKANVLTHGQHSGGGQSRRQTPPKSR